VKKETKNIIDNFPNLDVLLIKLRKNKQYSYQKIANYFVKKGYKCSRSLIQRLYKNRNINISRSVCGKNNSFYGKKHTKKTKEKISRSRIENKISKGKNNPMYGVKGKDAPGWKGGKSSRQMRFYASGLWKNKRLEIMRRDNFTCLLCGKNAKKKHNFLNVHHIIPLSKNWNKRLDNKNLITLCVPCHKKTFGNEKEMTFIFQNILKMYTEESSTYYD